MVRVFVNVLIFILSVDCFADPGIPEVDFILFLVDGENYEIVEYYEYSQLFRKSLPEWFYEVSGYEYIDYLSPCDHGHLKIYNSLTSQLVFNAELHFQGLNYPDFPPSTDAKTDLIFGIDTPDPVQIDYWPMNSHWETIGAEDSAWKAVKNTDVVNKLSSQYPYAVFVFVSNSYKLFWWVLIHTLPPAPKDVGIVDIIWPRSVLSEKVLVKPLAKVHNFGSNSEAFRMRLNVFEDVHLAFSSERLICGLSPDSMKVVEFDEWIPQPSNSYRIDVSLEDVNTIWEDTFNDNDKLNNTIIMSPLPVFRNMSSYREKGWTPLNTQPVDFDGDQDIDYFKGGVNPKLLKYIGNNQIVDITEESGVVFSDIHPRLAIFEDFTMDGQRDFIVIYPGRVQYFEKIAEDLYSDVTIEKGLAEVNPRFFGVAFDKENDGDLDIIMTGLEKEPEIIMENDGTGIFRQVDVGIDDKTQTAHIAVGDINQDGFTDVFLANWDGPHLLYINNGEGSFYQADNDFGTKFGRRVLFFDYDNDGLSDIFLVRNFNLGNPSFVFRNLGNLQFDEVSTKIGLNIRSLHADAKDFDADGDLDVLLDDGIFVNTNGQFELHSELFNDWHPYPYNIEKLTFVDLDNDGDSDVYAIYEVFENMGLPLMNDVEDHSFAPELKFLLSQNYPNPFNPVTTIKYQLSQSGHVKLVIYNLLGRRVYTLVDEWHVSGKYIKNWNGQNKDGVLVSSGLYFYELNVNDKIVDKKKMLLIH